MREFIGSWISTIQFYAQPIILVLLSLLIMVLLGVLIGPMEQR